MAGGFTQRAINATGKGAESYKNFIEVTYNDVAGNLTIGMPLYIDVTDAADNASGNLVPTTALVPATIASNKKVVLGTNTNAGSVIGVFCPLNSAETPVLGALIRVQTYGPGVVYAAAKFGGTAVLVGNKLVGDTTQTQALQGAAAVDNTIGTALPTGAAVAKNASIIAVPGSGQTNALVNAFIKLQ